MNWVDGGLFGAQPNGGGGGAGSALLWDDDETLAALLGNVVELWPMVDASGNPTLNNSITSNHLTAQGTQAAKIREWPGPASHLEPNEKFGGAFGYLVPASAAVNAAYLRSTTGAGWSGDGTLFMWFKTWSFLETTSLATYFAFCEANPGAARSNDAMLLFSANAGTKPNLFGYDDGGLTTFGNIDDIFLSDRQHVLMIRRIGTTWAVGLDGRIIYTGTGHSADISSLLLHILGSFWTSFTSGSNKSVIGETGILDVGMSDAAFALLFADGPGRFIGRDQS